MTIWFWLSVAALIIGIIWFILVDRRPDEHVVIYNIKNNQFEHTFKPVPWREWIGGWFK